MTSSIIRKCSLALGVVLAVSVLTAVAASGQDPKSAPAPAPKESRIWGAWPLVPWDGRAVEDPGWARALNGSFDLTRRGKAGERRVYEIKRTNLTVDREGKPLNRMIAEGRISRTLLREAEPGLWVERCAWERFASAQGAGPNDVPVPKELLGGRTIAFEFSPRDFDFINPPADFGILGNEVLGYLLKVLTMDATGWDAILLAVREEFGGKPKIGDTWRQSDWKPLDITRVGGEGSVGQYRIGEMQVSVIGLTRLQGQPCALLWISMEGNGVTQAMDTPGLAMDMKSTEYFRGEIAASLLDGHLVGMELWGPLPCVMKMGFGGQPLKEQPIGAIIQQLSMWEVPAGPEKTDG